MALKLFTIKLTLFYGEALSLVFQDTCVMLMWLFFWSPPKKTDGEQKQCNVVYAYSVNKLVDCKLMSFEESVCRFLKYRHLTI